MLPLTLVGVSGRSYVYQISNQLLGWPNLPGNYAFAVPPGLLGGRDFRVLYVGESESLKTRLSNHDRWSEAVRLTNSVRIFIRLNPSGEAARRQEEADLIAAYQPRLNTQMKGPGGLFSLGNSLLGGGRLG